MDRTKTRELTGRSPSDEHPPMNAEERAQLARLRFREAASRFGVLPSAISRPMERNPLAVSALALLGGFIIGYSPELGRSAVAGANAILRSALRLRI